MKIFLSYKEGQREKERKEKFKGSFSDRRKNDTCKKLGSPQKNKWVKDEKYE